MSAGAHLKFDDNHSGPAASRRSISRRETEAGDPSWAFAGKVLSSALCAK
jgi:hypothetical protein